MTTLPTCDYRYVLLNSSRFFHCGHTKMHAAGNLVEAAVCNACTLHDVPCRNPRPHPKNSILRVPLPYGAERLEYVTVEELVSDVRALTARLPTDLGAVAGIPRSGMLPASLVASYLHLPLYELSCTNGLRRLGCGARLETSHESQGPLLVIDDSVATGTAMIHARKLIEQLSPQRDAYFAAVYVTPKMEVPVDFIGRTAPSPHLFEWNLFNCRFTNSFAFDFDGVLCHDWKGGDETGAEYLDFLRNTKARWLPRRSPVRLIVTARLEKYREITIAWLKRHGVRVHELVMGPWSSTEERSKHFSAAEHKGRAFAESNCWLFIESDEQQAAAIFTATGKPVLCAKSGAIFQ